MENQDANNINQDVIQKQKEFQRILYQVELLSKHKETIETQIAILKEVIKQTNISMENINGLKKLANKKEMIIPIGEKVFIKVQLLSDNVLYNVGKKIFIEKNYEDAEKSLREDVVKLTKTLEEMIKKSDEIVNMIEQLNIQGQKIAAELGQTEGK